MSAGILTVDQKSLFDDSITHFEFHTHVPYESTQYGNNDVIRIPVQPQDVFTLPSESYLYIEGKLTRKSGVPETTDLNVKLVNNAMAFLFEEIRYELAGIEVDRTKNIGITTTIKNLLSVNRRDVKTLSNAGCVGPEKDTLNAAAGKFKFV